MRAITEARGRNSELAEEAVILSRAFTEEEALEANLIDLVSASTADLLPLPDASAILSSPDCRPVRS